MTDDERALLQELADRQRIHDVIVRYCRGVDRCDPDIINSAYHDDAEVAYQTFTAVGPEIGPAVVNLMEKTSPRKSAMHSVMNHLVQIEGDVAYAETYFVSAGVSQSDTPERLLENGGRYLDRLERRNGEWRISERTVVWDWRRTTDLPSRPDQNAGGGVAGSRTREDPSYKYLTNIV